MSPLDPPPFFLMIIQRSLPPEIQFRSLFILGDDDMLVAAEPRMESAFRRFPARRNERPNA
jgi:hypothetical protein